MKKLLPISLLLLVVAAGLSACLSQKNNDSSEFRDCPDCPAMISVPTGSFMMGTADGERLTDPRTGEPAVNDGPQHTVTFTDGFALGKTEVTVDQYAAFIAATGYQTVDRCMEFSKENTFKISKETNWRDTGFEQSGDQPVTCVAFFDAQAYAEWLRKTTGKNYRLPTEAEWEYAARAGTDTHYHWGSEAADSCDYSNVRSPGADAISKRQADSDRDEGFPCDDGYTNSSPAASFKPNSWGFHDMQGNAWEWVADCNHKDYEGAPTDGSAWVDEKACRFGIIRGGSFLNRVERSSTTVRAGRPRSGAATNMGFRIARGNEQADVDLAGRVADSGAEREDSEGAILFKDNCAACHLNSRGFEGMYGTDQQSLFSAIRDGGNNIMSMPAFADRLTDAEIQTLAAYLRKINGWDSTTK